MCSEALADAARATPVPDEGNARLTRELAAAALARDRALGWRVLDNPARLRILTIDALCASLARQMPVLSGMGAPAAIVDDARELYREAAQRTLARVEGGNAEARHLERLLAHLDGDWAACPHAPREKCSRDATSGSGARRSSKRASAARTALERAFRAERARIMARAHVAACRPRRSARWPSSRAHAAASHLGAARGEPLASVRRVSRDLVGPGRLSGGERGWRGQPGARSLRPGAAARAGREGSPQLRQRVDKGPRVPRRPTTAQARATRLRMNELLARLARIEGSAPKRSPRCAACCSPPAFYGGATGRCWAP